MTPDIYQMRESGSRTLHLQFWINGKFYNSDRLSMESADLVLRHDNDVDEDEFERRDTDDDWDRKLKQVFVL